MAIQDINVHIYLYVCIYVGNRKFCLKKKKYEKTQGLLG